MLAVKNVFRFIRWQWNRFSFFGKTMAFAWLCIFSSLFTVGTMNMIFTWGGIACLAVVFIKLFIEIVGTQYNEYKEERNSLFDTIKNSENVTGGKTLI